MTERRRIQLTESRIRAYSRRGNFHSDPDEARRIGMPGLLAQGMQVTGPAYGALLARWGGDFLERGEIDVRFIGPTWEDDTVEADVAVVDDEAKVKVHNLTTGKDVVAGTARLR